MSPAARQAISALAGFVPTGEEPLDVTSLYAIVDPLAGEDVRQAVPAMLSVFERFPGALLGSPGPLVHCIESTGMDSYVPALLDSFRKVPSRMALWMISRCLRSEPGPLLMPLLATLRSVRDSAAAADLREEIDEELAEHPAPPLRRI